jgi:hypothetical protein
MRRDVTEGGRGMREGPRGKGGQDKAGQSRSGKRGRRERSETHFGVVAVGVRGRRGVRDLHQQELRRAVRRSPRLLVLLHDILYRQERKRAEGAG